MMSELLKLKLEELTFDIAVVKSIATEQSYKNVEALQGGKESNPVDLLSSQGQSRSLNLRGKLSLQRKRVPHLLKSLVIKVATAVWAIMIRKVVCTKKENCHHCNKTGHIQRACKSKKRETQGSRPPVNYVDGDDGDSDDYLGPLEVNNMGAKDQLFLYSHTNSKRNILVT